MILTCTEIGNNIGLKSCYGIASQHGYGRTRVLLPKNKFR